MSTNTLSALMRHRNDRRWWAAVAALTLGGAGIRAVFLHDSLYLDEYYSWFEIHGFNSPLGIINSVKDSLELSPPLYHLLTLPFTAFNNSPPALRGPSFLLGTALIPASAAIARRAGGLTAGIFAAALVALSPFLTYFATEARPYTTAAFFSTLFVLFALRAAADSGPANWVGLTLAGTAALYTHYTTVFLVASVLLWLLLAQPASRLRTVVSGAVIGLLFLPWLPQVGDNGNMFVYGSVHGRGLTWFITSEARSLIGTTYVPLRVLPGMLPVVVAALVVLLLLAALVRQLRAVRPTGADPRVGLIISSLAIPTGLVVYSTVANTNLMTPRNFISATPVLLCLIAVAAASLKRRQLGATAAVALVLVLLVGTLQSTSSRLRRNPQAAATRLIERTLPPSGIVLLGGTWCGVKPGQLITSENASQYVMPKASSASGHDGRPVCPYDVSGEPTYFHGGSRGAVYLNPGYLIAPIKNVYAKSGDTHPGWKLALAQRRPVAVMIGQFDNRGRSSLWFSDPPPELIGKFRRTCFATFRGLFPIIVTVWQPTQVTPTPMPAKCASGSAKTGNTRSYWRDMAILSFGNGQALLPQHDPLGPTDLVTPILLLGCLAGTLAYSWRRRESSGSR